MNKRKYTSGISIILSLVLVATTGLAYAFQGLNQSIDNEGYLYIYKNSQYFELEVGSKLADQEKYSEAVVHFRKAVEQEPTNLMAQYNLGYSLMALYNQVPADQKQAVLDEAERAFLRVRDLNPNLTLTYFKLGKLAMLTEDYQRAAEYYRSGVENNPDNFTLAFNLANACEKNGNLDKAEKAYLLAIEINPKFVYAHNNLGLLYEKQEQYEKAELVYREAIRQVPDYTYARLNLANMLQTSGRLEEAEGMYKKTIEYEADNGWAYLYLGNTYYRLGRYEQAVNAYNKAIELNPDYPTTYYLMSLALHKLNRLDEALAQGLHYIQLAPNGAFSQEAGTLVLTIQQSKTQAKK